MKKIALKKEPVLRTHCWIVVTKFNGESMHYFCSSRKEVTDEIKTRPVGSAIKVFKAAHSFVEAWQK